MSLSGTLSKTRQPENMYTKFGPAPEYMFEDREKMQNMEEWFEKYGRPEGRLAESWTSAAVHALHEEQ